MLQPLITAAACRIDGHGSLAPVDRAVETITDRGLRMSRLHIAPLSHDWNAPLPPGWFRSGCAPLEALESARELLAEGVADAVVIRGTDRLRSEYAGNRELRSRRMAIYGEQTPLTEAYNDLAHAFCRNVGLDDAAFRRLADRLFENHRRVWEQAGNRAEPRPDWFEPVTDLFRRVDCANPVVDFEGAAVIASAEAAETCAVPGCRQVSVLGLALAQTDGDGPEHVEEIARYRHLAAAYREACDQAKVDFGVSYKAGDALLETYTCYPVVPLAFLLASGIAGDTGELAALLESHPVTVTGGMNLARAAWNNPALGGLTALWERLSAGDAPVAALHANGGLGQRQGVAILGGPRER